MRHDPSDLGSLIQIRIIPKERTLRVGGRKQGCGLYYNCLFGGFFAVVVRFKDKPAAEVDNE